MSRRNGPRLVPVVDSIAAEVKVASQELVAEEYVEDLGRIAREQTVAILRSPQFANQVRELVRESAIDCTKEILAEMMPDLETRVRAIVLENFDRSVAAAAHAILEDKLTELRRKLT